MAKKDIRNKAPCRMCVHCIRLLRWGSDPLIGECDIKGRVMANWADVKCLSMRITQESVTYIKYPYLGSDSSDITEERKVSRHSIH